MVLRVPGLAYVGEKRDYSNSVTHSNCHETKILEIVISVLTATRKIDFEVNFACSCTYITRLVPPGARSSVELSIGISCQSVNVKNTNLRYTGYLI